MDKNKIFISIFIILSFLACARHTVKNETGKITGKEVYKNIPDWSKEFNFKSGTGEIVLFSSEGRFSSYFSFKYNVKERKLTGELLGSFGMTVGKFLFSEDTVYLRDKDDREVENRLLDELRRISPVPISSLLMWDLEMSSNRSLVPVKNGWLLMHNNIETFISREFLPERIVIGEGKIRVQYSEFKEVIGGGTIQPFKIDAKSGNRGLEIELRKVQLQ